MPQRSAFRLSPMLLEDYDAVLDLWRRCDGLGELEERHEIAAFLERNPGLCFVARRGKRIVGAVLCGHDGRRGAMYHLAVDASHRKKGLGRALVEAALVPLWKTGIRRCQIHVFVSNATGAEFWKHLGFVRREELQLYYRDAPREAERPESG